MKKRGPVVKEFISVTQHLTDDHMRILLAEAQYRVRISMFLEDMSETKNRPVKYESEKDVNLPAFIQSEWIEKGFDPFKIDRDQLAAYDANLAAAVSQSPDLSDRYFPKAQREILEPSDYDETYDDLIPGHLLSSKLG